MLGKKTSTSKDPLTNQLREGFARYIFSYRFKQYVRRMCTGARWWNPLHRFAVIAARWSAKIDASRVATKGHPMIGAIMMQNTMLEDPKAVAPALVLGTFDVSPNGRTKLDNMTKRVDRIKLGEAGDPEFSEFLDMVYADENFTPGRRRTVPGSGSRSAQGGEIYFMDVMIRGDDAIQTGTSHDLMSHPTIVMLGQRGEETGVEAMPREVAELAIPRINGELPPDKVRIPKFRSPLRKLVLVIYAILGILALFVVGGVIMTLRESANNPQPLTAYEREERHVLSVTKGRSSGSNETAATNAERLSIRLKEWKQEAGAVPNKESRISLMKGEFVVRCIEQSERTIYLVGVPKLAFHPDDWTPQLKEIAWMEARRISNRSNRNHLPLVIAIKGFLNYRAILIGDPSSDEQPAELGKPALQAFFPEPKPKPKPAVEPETTPDTAVDRAETDTASG